MKKFFATIILVSGLYFGAASATLDSNVPEETKRVEILVNRVEEIRKMDMTELSKAEKKELKKELKALKKESKALGLASPIGLSIGGLIIIVLVLIIIL